MSQETSSKTGAELISAVSQDIAALSLPFLDQVKLQPYALESWTAAPYADNVRYNATSAQGTSLSLLFSSSVAKGTQANSLDMTLGGSDGARLTQKRSEKSPADGSFGAINGSFAFAWTYTGAKDSAADDLKISLKVSNKDTLAAYPGGDKYSGGSSVALSYNAGAGARQLSLQSADTYTAITVNSARAVDLNSTRIAAYSYSDLTGAETIKFSFAGTNDENLVEGTQSISWKNVVIQVGETKVTTKVLTATIDDSLNLSSMLDVDHMNELVRDHLLPLAAKGNNQFAGGSAADIIDAGAGNDTVSGNQGDDFLDGGTGRDQLSGGAGGDVFIFAACDCDATANASDQVMDFKFADGDQIHLNGVLNVSCRVAKAGVASFNAALANASKDFSEGCNVSIQFVGKNALLLADTNNDDQADLAVTLVGLKAGTTGFADYAESGAMFS